MYETKPLKLFEKAKELRLKHYRELMTAKEKGKLIMAGSAHAPKDLVVGIGEFEQICGEPWAASIAADPELSRRCLEAAEAKGYKRDMCAYMRLYWGSMFLNVSPWGGYPKPDFVLQSKICDSHGKWYQVVSEHLGIPCFITECPSDESQTLTKTRTTEYMAAQYADAIEWLKEITGREYNYEAMVQAVINSWRTKVLWSEICELNQAIPAPLSQNMMLALFMPAVLEYHRKEIVDFYRELKDEIKYRVEQGIAAEPNEKIRILHDGTPPWYALDLFKDYRKQGVAIIGGPYLFLQ
jgi:benzoyl-CoA reductase subunit B